MLGRDEKREIAWQSLDLFERLDVGPPADAQTGCETADEFVADWRERFDEVDDGAFDRRLAAAGVTEADCRRCACAEAWPEDAALPDWLDSLDDFVAAVADHGEPTDPGDRPFSAVLEPWAAHARDRLAADDPDRRLPDAVVDSLADWLRDRLLEVAAETLFLEFKTFATMRNPKLLFGDDERAPDSTDLYDEFAASMRSADGLSTLFHDYPLLARFITTTIRQWVESVAEFRDRLHADRDALERTFAPDGLGELADVTALTDDRHADGRAVFEVAFSSGVRVAYKPRSVETGRRWDRLLDWVTDRCDLDFRTTEYVARDDHGWMEWMPREECEDDAAVRRYYRRAGGLLAVAFVVGLNDVQFENLVASGEQPVIVDAETVMQPGVDADKDAEERLLYEEVASTALNTGMVPWRPDQGDDADLSGLGATEVEAYVQPDDPRRWEHTNTDAMELEQDVVIPDTADNLPLLDGEVQPAAGYVDAIVDGFDSAYRALRDGRDALLADDGPLRALADAETRFLYASTDQYYQVVRAVTSPGTLEDGLRMTHHTETLSAVHFAADRAGDALGTIHVGERAALRRLDVPRLTTRPTTRDAAHDDRTFPDAVDTPGFDLVRGRLDALGDDDRRKQTDYVRLALGDVPGDVDTPNVEDALDGEPADAADPESWATGVADAITDHARDTDDGDLAWIHREKYDDSPVYVHLADDDLYGGRGGTAVFLAALHAVHGDDDARDRALDAIDPLRDHSFGDDAGLGVGDGVGSAVYALRTTGELLGDDELVADAEQAARAVTPERVEADDDFDVISGSAGAVLALLALHDTTGDDRVLERAVACGDRLLAGAVDAPEGGCAWPTGPDGERLTGFAHGAAGVSYALARLAAVSDASRFREAAADAVAFEHAVYDGERGNWPDRRFDDDRFMDAWCNGRTGVGLARLGTLPALDSEPVRADLQRALDGRSTDRVGTLDTLCCGNAGRVGFLVAAGRRLDEPAYLREARELAAAVTRRADDRGELVLQSHTARLHDPTLFQGPAGVGYALLRAARPDELPSVLLLE